MAIFGKKKLNKTGGVRYEYPRAKEGSEAEKVLSQQRQANKEKMSKLPPQAIRSGDPEDKMIEPKDLKGIDTDDFRDTPKPNNNGGVTVNVNLGNGRTTVDDDDHRPPMLEDSKDVPKKSVPTPPGTVKGLKKEIESEKIRKAAIIKSQKKKAPLEKELEKERAKTEGILSGKYKPTFCDKHPKVCNTAKNIKTAAVVATAPVWLSGKAVKKTADATVKGVGTVKGAIDTRRKTKTEVEPQAQPRTKSKTAQKPRKSSSKPKTTTGTAKPRKTRSAPVSAQKKKGIKSSTKANKPKSTSKPKTKKKSPSKKKGSSDGWWGYGEGGL